MFDSISALRVSLASPEQIRAWSAGEVVHAETLHYKTRQPIPGGLFCERIFGPVRDWSCACGKYRRERRPEYRCEKCGVELSPSSVRRERMGHIELATPVAHTWFARATPSIIAVLLGISTRALKEILAYSAYVVLSCTDAPYAREEEAKSEGGEVLPQMPSPLAVGDILSGTAFREIGQAYGSRLHVLTGAEAIQAWLRTLDLESLASELRDSLAGSPPNPKQLVKRLRLVEAFRTSGVSPSWMILDVLPVLPPELRPLVAVGGGRWASSDINALYERVLHRNKRIKEFQARGAPDLLLNQEKRLLQDACDALLDNARRARPVMGSQKQPLKSLSDTLKGKQGRFRRNLLGKRVDYSGRSVIVGDTSLQLHQCGLPTKICLELFKPFLIRKMIDRGYAPNVRVAKRMVERARSQDVMVWDALAEVLYRKVVLLNRAPTLHRLSIQAFEVVWMSDSNAIRLHPCVCSAFNADFDGDQMAVHLPLSDAAQEEARALMLSTRNLRSPAAGEPSVAISQEMVLGLFYLTQERPSAKAAGRVFADATEALIALEQGIIDLHTRFFVRLPDQAIFDVPGTSRETPRRVETTAGRLLLNDVLPPALRYKNYEMSKERLKLLIAESLRLCGEESTARLADALKAMGFHYATRSGISFSTLSDIAIPDEKHVLLAEADRQAQEIEDLLHQGMITQEERQQQLIGLWTRTTESISRHLEQALDPWGSLSTIIKSGATKAKFQQIRQLSGIRGLMANPSGQIIPVPVRGNYLEGLKTWEIFIAGSGARKGFMDRSLNTARSGYLTRKLVEAGTEVWIVEEECGTHDSLQVTQEESLTLGLPHMGSRLLGRVLAEPLPTIDLPRGTLLTEERVTRILGAGIAAVQVRSPLTCEASYGLCQQCYGMDLASGRLVLLGTAVGIIAGQSVGEPGTQLTMRTFHSGGIAGAQGDITQGLPRVEELFDGRPPKHKATLSAVEGVVGTVRRDARGRCSIHIVAATGEQIAEYMVDPRRQVLVNEGSAVWIGTPLTDGAPDPQEVLQFMGRAATAKYLVDEIQRVYRNTGVYLADKHVECIVRQMLRYVRVTQAGDTPLLPESVVDRFDVLALNANTLAQGGTPAMVHPVLLGLTKAVLQTKSWLAAASFQETSRVLMDAAIHGQRDDIVGFKERLVLGKRLPSLQPASRGTSTRSPTSFSERTR